MLIAWVDGQSTQPAPHAIRLSYSGVQASDVVTACPCHSVLPIRLASNAASNASLSAWR